MPLRKNTLCLIESLVLFLKLPYSVSKQLNSKISKGITNYICYGIIDSCLHVFSELYGVTLCTAGILAKQLRATLTLVGTMYLTETPQK